MTYPAATPAYDNLSLLRLKERLSRYGFVECCMLICFLDMCCSDKLGMGELFYIRSKIRDCLWHYDEGSAWFDDLRLMEMEVSRSLLLQQKKHHSGYLPDAFTSGCTCPGRNGNA